MPEDVRTDQGRGIPTDPNLCAALLALTITAGALAYSFQLTSFMHAKQLTTAVALLLIAIVALRQNRSPWTGARIFAPLWILLAYTTIVHAGFRFAQVPTYTLEATTYYATLLLLAAYGHSVMDQSPGMRRALRTCIIVSTAAVATLGLLQYAGYVDWLFPAQPEYTQRAYSVFGNQDLFGGYVALGIPLAIAALAHSAPRPRPILALLALLIAALLISGSRSAWVAAGVGALIAFPYRHISTRGPRILVAVAIATTITMTILSPASTINRVTTSFSSQDVGIQTRLWFWDASLRMLRDAPVIGIGPGNFTYWSPLYQGDALHANQHHHNALHTLHAHSDPLEVAVETGLIGLALLAWMLWTLRKHRGPEWGALAAYFTFGLFNTTLHSPPHILVTLLLIGALSSSSNAEENERQEFNPQRTRLLNGAAIAIAFLLLACTLGMTVLPSYRLNAAREAYDASAERTDALYAKALAYPWPQYEAAEDWGIALLETQRIEELGPILDQARQGRDTWTVHYLSARALEHTGNTDAALEEYRECLWRWPGYLPAWRALLVLTEDPQERQILLDESRTWLSEKEWSTLPQAPH